MLMLIRDICLDSMRINIYMTIGNKTYKGWFKPKNPQKYKGDSNNIVFRSSWEHRVMKWFDEHPQVEWWGSEELVISYISPVDNKKHRYFPDFVVKVKTQNGFTKTMMLEVKPKHQTVPPEPQKRATKKYITEVVTYGVNQAKWKYADEYCKDRGWEFRVLTEEHLGL